MTTYASPHPALTAVFKETDEPWCEDDAVILLKDGVEVGYIQICRAGDYDTLDALEEVLARLDLPIEYQPWIIEPDHELPSMIFSTSPIRSYEQAAKLVVDRLKELGDL